MSDLVNSALFESDLFDSDGAIFMGSRRQPAACSVAIFGVPYDGTTSFRPGARFGPAAIREVSNGLESYCPQLNLDLEDLAFVDLGAVNIPFGAPGAGGGSREAGHRSGAGSRPQAPNAWR